MKNLEITILKNSKVIRHSKLIEELKKENLSENENQLLNKIWEEATDFSNWNNSDLTLGCKITHQRLKNNFDLSDEAIAVIVRLAAYEWK